MSAHADANGAIIAAMLLQAWRTWRHAKSVAVLATAALAIGIGSATAIYTVVNTVMLKPLPYPDGDRFVALFSAATSDPGLIGSLRADDARAYEQKTTSFDAFGWFRSSGKNLMFAGEPHHVEGVAVTQPLVDRLGVAPALGRWFHDDTGVVISHRLWRQLGSDAAIVGKPLTLDGRRYVVTGVMADSFQLPIAGVTGSGVRAELWLALDPRENAGVAYFVYARRKPDVPLATAAADVTRVAADIRTADPANHPAYTSALFDLRALVVKEVRPTLLLLFAAAGLLFLVTCANAAGVVLAHAVAHARNTAVRVALGISRRQLAAHYLAQICPVAVAGAIGGLALSFTLTPAIVAMASSYLPRAEEVAVDGTVLAFAVLAAIAAAVLASLAPLWLAVRTDPGDALGDGARTSSGTHGRQMSHLLVIAEIAVAFALVAAGALLVDHLRGLTRTAAGFDAEHLLTFSVSVPGTLADDQPRLNAFQRQLMERLGALPGVQGVAFANQLPLDGCCMGTTIYPEGRQVDLSASQRTSLMIVPPEYVATMRIPLRRGRLLTRADVADNLAFVMINQAAATRYWGVEDPVGRYGRFGRASGDRFQVVGVLGDVKNDGLGNAVVPEVYLLSDVARVESMHVLVRSSLAAAALVPEVRRTIRGLDAEQPIHDVAMMTDVVRRSMTLERTTSMLTGIFAVAAVLMAMLGVYGVIAYSMRQRIVEIGTRMALGATARTVLVLILSRGLMLTLAGLVAGAGLAAVETVYLRRVFTMTMSATPFLSSTVIIGIVAAAAALVPAWRMSRLSPLVAIRNGVN